MTQLSKEPIGGDVMRLIPRSRNHQRAKPPRISITQEEILADLLYPAGRRRGAKSLTARVRGLDR